MYKTRTMLFTTAGPCNEDLKPKYDRLAKRPEPKKPPAWKGNIYIFDKEENFEIYMKKLGVGKVLRRMGRELKPIAKLTFDDKEEQYALSILANYLNYEAKFELEEPFDDETFDGRKVKSTFTMDKDVLTQIEENECGDKTKIVREFTLSDLKTTFTHGDMSAVRYYKSMIKQPEPKIVVEPEPIKQICPPMTSPTKKNAITVKAEDNTKEEDKSKSKDSDDESGSDESDSD